MSTLQSIMAATDFSNFGQHAADRTAWICAATRARGCLLHVVPPHFPDTLKRLLGISLEMEKSVLEKARRHLGEVAESSRARTETTLDCRVSVGRVTDTVLQAAMDSDVLALGVRGKQPLRELALGTTAEHVIRQSNKPVLVVKQPAREAYRRVLVAVDFSTYSRNGVAWAQAIAPRAELTLAHVVELPFELQMRYSGVSEETVQAYRTQAREEAQRQMTDFVAGLGLQDPAPRELLDLDRHVPSRLQEMVTDSAADLVVAGRHGTSLTEHLLLGSITQHLLAESPCDVLVVGPGKP